MEKWVSHQEKKFFRDNAVQALIPFKEGHRGLVKLYAHLREEVPVWEKGINFL